MEEYYALLTYKGECVSGVIIHQGTSQEIASSIAENLKGYLEGEILSDRDEKRWVKKFIKDAAAGRVTADYLRDYACNTDIGHEEIMVFGGSSDSATIVEMAKALYRNILGEELEVDLAACKQEGKALEECFSEQERQIIKMYELGKAGQFPDGKLLCKIELSFSN